MTSFKLSAGGLIVRPAEGSDLIGPDCRAGDLQTFEYIANGNPAMRRLGGRQATAASVAYAVHAASTALNHASVSVWVKRWLSDNAANISTRMSESNHNVFIMQVNYIRIETALSLFYRRDTIHILGTVPGIAQVRDILTPQLLHGPQTSATQINNMHSLQAAYLVGQRTTTTSNVLQFNRPAVTSPLSGV